MILFTSPLPNYPEINSVKYHTWTQFICNMEAYYVNSYLWMTHLVNVNNNECLCIQSGQQ